MSRAHMKRLIGGPFASLKDVFKSTSIRESELELGETLHENHKSHPDTRSSPPLTRTADIAASSTNGENTRYGFENTCNHCQNHVYPFIHSVSVEFDDTWRGSMYIDLAPEVEYNARSRGCKMCQTLFEIRWSTSEKERYYLHAFSAAISIYQKSAVFLQPFQSETATEHIQIRDSPVFAVLGDESGSVSADFALYHAMGAEVLIKYDDQVGHELSEANFIDLSALDKEHSRWLVKDVLKIQSPEDRAQPLTIVSAIQHARAMGFVYELSYKAALHWDVHVQPVTIAELRRRQETGAKHVLMAAVQPINTGNVDTPGSIGYVPHSIRDGDSLAIQSLSASSFCGRILQAKIIDYSLLRGWLRQCKKHCHLDGLVTDQERFEEIEFKLIDVQERRIITVEHETHRVYVALSYVWGSSPYSVSSDDTEDSDLLPQKCVAVVEDAMKVVHQLGFRYLWVDHFCISQNSESRHDQIASMDVIYKNAELTIIAAAGTDAAHGLPGVGSRSRKPQYQAKIGDHHLVASSVGSRHWDLHSTYSNRAWTYQEFCFSRRRLIFTEYQVSYNCHDRCVGPGQQESMVCPPQRLFTPIHRPDQRFYDKRDDAFVNKIPANYLSAAYGRDGTIMHKPLGHIGKWPTLIAFEYHVAEFTRRTLSFDQDSLQAVISIIDRFRSNSQPISHLQGLPFAPRDRPHSSKKEAAGDNEGLSLNYGLLWTHGADKTALRRREAFPSWSWTGWEGEVHWLPDSSYSNLCTERTQRLAPNLATICTTTSGNAAARQVSAVYWRSPIGDERHPVELYFDGPLIKIDVRVRETTVDSVAGLYFSGHAQRIRIHVTNGALDMSTLCAQPLYALQLAYDSDRHTDYVLVVRQVAAPRSDIKRRFLDNRPLFERVGVMVAPTGSFRATSHTAFSETPDSLRGHHCDSGILV